MWALGTPERWTALLATLPAGKRVADAVYLHYSALPIVASDFVGAVAAHASVPDGRVVVCKFHVEPPRVSLLDYPTFFEAPFPALAASWTVDLGTGDCTARQYDADSNPPILHRKERMLHPEHPEYQRFAALTAKAEAAGLFADPAIIGQALGWEEELRARGLVVRDHDLVAVTATPDASAWFAQRHRTALRRTGLSSPVQALWRHGFLAPSTTFFDYGCGRGDDVALLSDRDVAATGWDPWFRQAVKRTPAEIVNLGFVLNVIEDLRERRAALEGAWQLAGKVLAVAALIGGRTAQDRWRLYQDGVLTSIGTFQKYYSHAELGAYIADVVGRPPVAVQPGVYFVFRQDSDEQDFLERRHRSYGRWLRAPVAPAPRRIREPRARLARERTPSRWELHAELAAAFWEACCELGRIPDETEWSRLADVTGNLGRPETVLRRLLTDRGAEAFDEARASRIDDLRVYLALQLFERRSSFSSLSGRLQRDIRAFWGSLTRALDDAKALLFSAGAGDAVGQACEAAAERGLAWLERDAVGDASCLYCLTDRIEQLAPVLRVYVGCAGRMYGDLSAADAVKIHVRSAKLTALTYDDFWGRPVPDLLERVKIDLRRQEIDVFGYGSNQYPPQPLWHKSRLMGLAAEGHGAQLALEERIQQESGLDFNGFGPTRASVLAALETQSAGDLAQLVRA